MESTTLLTPTRELPPELVDAIIELLRADRAALKACALVCRSWVPISRHHLPLRVVLSGRNVRKTTEILLATTCTVASAIEHLVLYGVADWREVSQKALDLCRLKQITFRNTMLWCAPPSGLDDFFPTLQNLHLEEVAFMSNWAWSELLRHLPRLQSLSCRKVQFTESIRLGNCKADDLRLPNPDELMPELKSFQMYRSWDFRLFHWLMEHWKSAAPPLTTLGLDDRSIWGLDDLEARMSSLGLSLQVLHLSAHPSSLLGIARRFALLTKLHSLDLDYSYGSGSGTTTLGLEVTINALKNLTSPHLEVLIITVESETCGSLNLDTWSALNSILESPQFSPTLRTLVFRFQEAGVKMHPRVVRARRRWIEKRFPSYAERGILRVEHRAKT